MKKMLCPYKVKMTHVVETFANAGVDEPEFCECDYDACYFFSTHTAFDKDGHRIEEPECKRTRHECEVN